jgi:hypothetical protein
MSIFLILAGLALLAGAWVHALASNWNAPDGKAGHGSLVVALIGVACFVAAIVRILI